MTKKQKRAFNKKIHLMTWEETRKKIRWLEGRGKTDTTYYNNLYSHLDNLSRRG